MSKSSSLVLGETKGVAQTCLSAMRDVMKAIGGALWKKGKCNENWVKRNVKRNTGFSSENDVFLM